MKTQEGSGRPPIKPLENAHRVRFHSDEELDRLREATLHVLERVGVTFPSARALDLLSAHGARVDARTQVVRFPPDLVLRALATVPRFYTLGARDPAFDLRFAEGVTYLSNDGCGHLVLDIGSTTTRPSTKDDVARAAQVCDYLSAISFLWPMISAQDCGATAPLHEIDALWSNSIKHVQGFVHGAAAARRAVEMATIVAGGEEARRARPPLSAMVCTVSPLMQDREAIEAALEFAAAGVPVGFTAMPTMGTTAPATMAGLLTVADAEVVSATVLVQLAAPGAPVFHSILPATCDPRTGAYVPKPLNRFGRQTVIEIAHHWGVPSQVGGFGTAARKPGTWQAAAEVALDLYPVALAGADMVAGIGLLDGSTVLALDSLLLDADLYHRTRYALRHLAIDDETLALDTVEQVGPGGHYLGTRHTRRHLRETVVPGLQHEAGPDGQYRDPLAVARERVASILERHRPEPLTDDQRAELDEVLDAAGREAASLGPASLSP